MSSLALFAPGEPRVFATAPGAPYAQAVAEGLIARAQAAGADPSDLADVVVVAATQRSVRALRSAFARCGGAAVTPRMTSLADLDAAAVDPAFLWRDTPQTTEDGSAVPPAVDGLRRLLLLSQLVRRLLIQAPHLAATAVAPRLAEDLAGLLDDCWAAGVPIDAAARLAPEHHASHWALAQAFLSIIAEAWPALLAEQPGAPIDPGDRRRRVLSLLTAFWSDTPPERPVVVAGSPTDATAAEMIKLIAGLPQGAVVLPGYDLTMDAGAVEALLSGGAPEHPQAALALLVSELGLSPVATGPKPIALWSTTPSADAARMTAAPRLRLLSQAMRPAPATDAWRIAAGAVASEAAAATAGLTLLEAPSPREEAAAAALALREALETPGRTAALITPDRTLARRVATELARWGINPDDSSGRPLALTPPGVFFASVLDCVSSGFAPAALLAMVKHPLCAAGLPRGTHLRLARRLEREALRRDDGPLVGAAQIAARVHLDAAVDAVEQGDDALLEADTAREGPTRAETPAPDRLGLGPDDAVDAPSLPEWFDALVETLAPLTDMLAADEAPLDAILTAHEAVARALSARMEPSDDGAGARREALYDKIAGETLADFLGRLLQEADAYGPITPRDYPALLSLLMGREAVREPFGRHPRILILGALEARMQSADLVVLAGLNEGVWPKAPEPDPWLSRDMRRRLGLPPLEAKIGLSAHDFMLAAMAKTAILSRTRKTDGAPTTPSRWLMRLTNLLEGVAPSALADMSARGDALLARLERLDAGPPRASVPTPAPRPNPRPPLAARPRQVSVTDVETLIRDPYAVYARKTLRLRAVAPLDPTPDHRNRGQFLHRVVEEYVRESMTAAPQTRPAAAARYDRIVGAALAAYVGWPTLYAFWRARAAQIRDWFLDGEAARADLGGPAALETFGALRFETALGFCELTAKADRIDRIVDPQRGAGYAIYDYKAGGAPSADEQKAFAKQLPLEAAILKGEGFNGAKPGPVAKLAYLTLSGGAGGGAEVCVEGDPDALGAAALAGLTRLLGGYADPRLGYAARRRPQMIRFEGDYDHLSRFGEWSLAETPGAPREGAP